MPSCVRRRSGQHMCIGMRIVVGMGGCADEAARVEVVRALMAAGARRDHTREAPQHEGEVSNFATIPGCSHQRRGRPSLSSGTATGN
jgi:hypothetical protein